MRRAMRGAAAPTRTILAAAMIAALAGCASVGQGPEIDPPAPASAPARAEVDASGTEEPADRESGSPLADAFAWFDGEPDLPEVVLEDDAEVAATFEDVEYSESERFETAPHDDLAEAHPEIDSSQAEEERTLAEDHAPTYDIPVELNEKVLAWIDHYSNRHPDQFLPGLVRSGRYLPMIRRIFEEEGLPQDLVYMAHVESAYKVRAYSRAGAKGVFQFISATGRRYDLRIDYWVDERSDVEKSARAAAAYLRDLYEEFGDWYLALAGYNAGEGKIRRGLARTGADDFWSLADTRYIRRETKNYVPAILAAVIISKDPAKYGFEFTPDEPVEYDTLAVDGAVDLRVLARCAGSDTETLNRLNPALRRQQTPPGATTDVRLPKGSVDATRIALAAVPTDERVLYERHVVRSGDTLWEVSRAYRVSIRGIQDANGMGQRTLLRPGQVLKIPTSTASSYGSMAEAPPVAEGEAFTYRIRRGDSLTRIARRYDTTPRAIAATNGISVNKTIYPGERLRVVPGARYVASSAAVASGGSRVHTVRRGDTLWDIARVYRSSVTDICAANRISPHATLYPGAKLNIP